MKMTVLSRVFLSPSLCSSFFSCFLFHRALFLTFCQYFLPIERWILLYSSLNEPSKNKQGASALCHPIYCTQVAVPRCSHSTCARLSIWVGWLERPLMAAGSPTLVIRPQALKPPGLSRKLCFSSGM